MLCKWEDNAGVKPFAGQFVLGYAILQILNFLGFRRQQV